MISVFRGIPYSSIYCTAHSMQYKCSDQCKGCRFHICGFIVNKRGGPKQGKLNVQFLLRQASLVNSNDQISSHVEHVMLAERTESPFVPLNLFVRSNTSSKDNLQSFGRYFKHHLVSKITNNLLRETV